MTKTPKKAKSRSALPRKPAVNLPTTVKPRTGSQLEPQADMAREHPHQNLDRTMRAAAARLTGGVSPHAFIEAWGDWALHMSRAPGRQLELVERAQRNAARLISQAMAADSETAPAFVPKAYDHRAITWGGRNHRSKCGSRGSLRCRTGGTTPPIRYAVCALRTPGGPGS